VELAHLLPMVDKVEQQFMGWFKQAVDQVVLELVPQTLEL
jgi:hypothetical protein